MPELKILTHTTYTYETSDGRTFEDDREAAEHWQQSLDNLSGINMLDSKFNKTLRHDEAFYVHIKTWEQQEAFEALQLYEGMGAHIPKPGFWYYDDGIDAYMDLNEELERLSKIKSLLQGETNV